MRQSSYRSAMAAACVLLLSTAQAASEFEVADRVVVRKADRELLLMKGERILKTVKVALGLSPRGHKLREGDFRTPEGSYLLAERNLDSDYFLSIRISYPNDQDVLRANRQGVSPGGQIMIHGQPNRLSHPPQYYRERDWTNGCIAVSNADMVDIWLMTTAQTPIQILP